MGELGGTMMEPSAVVKGEKVKSAPPLRSRETHSQSVAMMSTEPPCRPTVVAWVLASGIDVELDAFGLVEAVGADGVEHPADRAEFEYADRNLVRRVRGLRKRKARYGADQES